MKASSQRLPGLDGLRAIAVSFVLFAHVLASDGWVESEWMFQIERIFSGLLGVQIFFAISGFIITLLLLREKRNTGTISLKQFWLRRALRILPPALAFLLILQMLGSLNLIPLPAETQLGSLFFYRNMMPDEPWFSSRQGFTSHYWSLSVEEQFYLIWPFAVAALAMARLRILAWLGVGLSIALRICLPWWYEGELGRWLPLNLDGFMIGALVGIEVAEGHSMRWQSLWRIRWPLLVITLILTRLYASKFHDQVEAIQPVAAAIMTGVWIAGLINRPAGFESRLLNSRPLVGLGLISYSVYLWQQLCLGPSAFWTSGKAPWLSGFPQNILAALVCGALSYLFIEQPFLWLKNWMAKRHAPSVPRASVTCPL